MRNPLLIKVLPNCPRLCLDPHLLLHHRRQTNCLNKNAKKQFHFFFHFVMDKNTISYISNHFTGKYIFQKIASATSARMRSV